MVFRGSGGFAGRLAVFRGSGGVAGRLAVFRGLMVLQGD